VDGRERAESRAEEASRAERRRILDRLNSIDTGVSRYEREQEERRARGIDIAREKERRPDPGAAGGFGC
jgi:hypothetical protein